MAPRVVATAGVVGNVRGMTTNENEQQGGAEQGATPEAVALHGDQARAERYDQPDAIELPAGTRIAAEADPDADREV